MAYCNTVMTLAFQATPLTVSDRTFVRAGYEHNREQLVSLSTQKKILPFVGAFLYSLGIDDGYWQAVVKGYRKRNRYMLSVLGRVFDSFHRHGIRKAFVFENFGALLACGGDLALFASGDIDVHIAPEERSRVTVAMREAGFYPKSHGTAGDDVSTSFCCDHLEEPFYIAVMWKPLSRAKRPFLVHRDVIAWDTLVAYQDTRIMLPSHNTLAYLCLLHVSVHGYSRPPDIRLYQDIGNIARLPVCWKTIARFMEKDGYGIRVLTASIIAKELFGISIPEDFLNKRVKYENKIRRLLRIVYDRPGRSLIYNPRGVSLLKIEAYSDGRSLPGGLLSYLFPPPDWVRARYKTNVCIAYVKHIRAMKE